jgi:hypothetical protein
MKRFEIETHNKQEFIDTTGLVSELIKDTGRRTG